MEISLRIFAEMFDIIDYANIYEYYENHIFLSRDQFISALCLQLQTK